MENNTETAFLVIRRDMGVLGLALFRTPATTGAAEEECCRSAHE